MVKLPTMNNELVADEICEFIRDIVKNQNKTGAVVGLSGGIDSAVVALLTLRAFENTDYEIKVYTLPGNTYDSFDWVRAKNLAIKHKIDINFSYIDDLVNTTEEHFGKQLNPFDKGNMVSRIRANLLSTYAAVENKVLLGTGNKDEDFGIGYYTLFGDGAVHCSPIGGLSKRLVYQMAEYLGAPEEIIKATPTAGLEEGQTDYGDLGYGYDVVEFFIEAITQKIDAKLIIDEAKTRHFKYNEIKFKTVEDIFLDIIDRHQAALMKMRIIHPPVAKITLEYNE